MKSKWHILRIFLLFILLGFLFSYSNKRNQERELTDVLVVFTNPKQPFIPMENVQALLVNKEDSIYPSLKDISLKELEDKISAHPMVAKAEVFLSIDGVLGAEVTQRTPIGRYIGQREMGYLDELGVTMPLSTSYSARVPLLYGVEDSISRANVLPLLLAIKEDVFMNSSVVTIIHDKDGNLRLQIRQADLDVSVGSAVDLEQKFRKLRGFIKYTRDNNILEDYKAINLKYENQVVATKK